jgi:hypothetical protein
MPVHTSPMSSPAMLPPSAPRSVSRLTVGGAPAAGSGGDGDTSRCIRFLAIDPMSPLLGPPPLGPLSCRVPPSMEQLGGGGRVGGVSLGMTLRPPDPSKGGGASRICQRGRGAARRRGEGGAPPCLTIGTALERGERREGAPLGVAEGRGRRGFAWVHGGIRAARRGHYRNRREEA